MILGIDVSENNGTVDWQAVKDAGVEFAIVRSSYGQHGQDSMFLENVNGAHEVGLKVGAYHYGYGLNPQQAIIEADNCFQTISNAGILLELPVFYDMEDADHYKENNGFDFSADNITSICRSFLDSFGLNKGIYASLDWFDQYIDWRSFGCSVWNAQWGSQDDIQGYMWQFSSTYDIGGKQFDANYIYD